MAWNTQTRRPIHDIIIGFVCFNCLYIPIRIDEYTHTHTRSYICSRKQGTWTMLCMERTKLKWQWHLPQSSKKRIIYSLIFAFSPSPFSSCSLVFCFCIQVSLCRISTFNLVLLLKLFCTFDCSFFNYVVCVCVCVPVCCNSIEMTSFVFSLEKMYHI